MRALLLMVFLVGCADTPEGTCVEYREVYFPAEHAMRGTGIVIETIERQWVCVRRVK